jgi:peptide/nickel transport system substrate-binding protein
MVNRRTLLALHLCLLLSACNSRVPLASSNSIEVTLSTPPATLDPRFCTDTVGVRTTRLIHAGLVGLDPTTLAPVPLAAQSWRWLSPTKLEVTLRHDIQFSSGTPLRPEDVCATLQALADPKLASPHRSLAKTVSKCTILDSHMLTLELTHPRATFLTDLELPILRKEQAYSPPSPDGRLDGLGPYTVSFTSPEVTYLHARAGGVVPKPKHDLALRVVQSENARALRLLSGKTDIVPNGISASLLPTLKKEGAILSHRPGANLTYLLIHNQRQPFQQAAVRHALGEAIDRQALISAFLGGHARLAGNFLPPDSWANNGASKQASFQYNPEHARQVFASLPRNDTISLITSTDRQRQLMGRAVAQMLQDLGLPVEVTPLDLGVMIQRLNAGEYELAILQIPEFTEPNLLTWFFHSHFIPDKSKGQVGANRARYQQKDVDAWLDEASLKTDIPTRRNCYQKVMAQMISDMPVVPLFHEDQVALLSQRASMFKLSAEGRWASMALIP